MTYLLMIEVLSLWFMLIYVMGSSVLGFSFLKTNGFFCGLKMIVYDVAYQMF